MQWRKLTYVLPPIVILLAGTAAGVLVLGLVVPGVLFLIAVWVFNDLGGPLFWPIFVLGMMLIGAVAGFGFSVLWLLSFWLFCKLMPRSIDWAVRRWPSPNLRPSAKSAASPE
jgi:hypothetical protein